MMRAFDKLDTLLFPAWAGVIPIAGLWRNGKIAFPRMGGGDPFWRV